MPASLLEMETPFLLLDRDELRRVRAKCLRRGAGQGTDVDTQNLSSTEGHGPWRALKKRCVTCFSSTSPFYMMVMGKFKVKKKYFKSPPQTAPSPCP